MFFSLTGGSGFSSKPTTPTGSGGAFPPSPQRSPQHMGGGAWQAGGGFPSWQQGGGAQWQPQQQQGKGVPPPQASPQHRPNYNIGFSSMAGTPNASAKPGVAQSEKNLLLLRPPTNPSILYKHLSSNNTSCKHPTSTMINTSYKHTALTNASYYSCLPNTLGNTLPKLPNLFFSHFWRAIIWYIIVVPLVLL